MGAAIKLALRKTLAGLSVTLLSFAVKIHSPHSVKGKAEHAEKNRRRRRPVSPLLLCGWASDHLIREWLILVAWNACVCVCVCLCLMTLCLSTLVQREREPLCASVTSIICAEKWAPLMANLLVSRPALHKGAKIICCVFTQKYLAGTGAIQRKGR